MSQRSRSAGSIRAEAVRPCKARNFVSGWDSGFVGNVQMFLLDLLAVCFGFRLPFHNLEPFHLLRTERCLSDQSKIK